jgi:hypothetical protein
MEATVMPEASRFLCRVLGMPLEIRTDHQFTSQHWRHSYYQICHRQRGEIILIRGTSGTYVRNMKQQLRTLRGLNMPLIDLAHTVYAAKLAEFDLQPLSRDSEEFVFTERVGGEISENHPFARREL